MLKCKNCGSYNTSIFGTNIYGCFDCFCSFKIIEDMNAKNLINWGELSRILSGSRQTVRKNSIPKIHKEFISELLQAIDEQLSKLPDTANAGGQKENKT